MKVEVFTDGYVIHGDSTSDEVMNFVSAKVGLVPLIIADPPYGNIVKDEWDKVKTSEEDFVKWMVSWTWEWSEHLVPGGAFYVWGGIGKPEFRPFLRYVCEVEVKKEFEVANIITWKKRRGYGVQNNYLFTREECVYFVNGNAKRPHCFNIPLLEDRRGYAGYNKKYPAKSEYYRRTNVWTDITEMFSGKVHPTQKAQRLCEVMIEIHTAPGEWVIDPFAGAGTTAFAARKLGRKFVIIEKDEEYFQDVVKRLTKTPEGPQENNAKD